MTGAVIRVDKEDKDDKTTMPGDGEMRLLDKDELTILFNEDNAHLNAGIPENGGNYSISYQYKEGDCIFIDNMSIAHKASP